MEYEVQSNEAEPMLAGDWDLLTKEQKMDTLELRDLLCKDLITEIERFYKVHPELKIDFSFQVEPRLRVKSVHYGHIELRFQHEGTIYEGTAYAVEEIVRRK